MVFFCIKGVNGMGDTTNKLFKMIEQDPNEFLKDVDKHKLTNSKSLFTAFFYKMLDEKKIPVKEITLKTNISQSHLYQIISGIKGVSRDKAIMISVAMCLNLEQTQRFLELSHNAPLYPKVKRDAIIICCIEFGMSLEETNDKLEEKNEKGLI